MNLTRLTWDLDAVYPGGSRSPQLAQAIDRIGTLLDNAEKTSLPDSLSAANHPQWTALIQSYYEIGAHLAQCRSFISCLVSQDVNDELALQLNGRVDRLGARYATLWTLLAAACAAQSDDTWEALVSAPALSSIRYALDENRIHAQLKMSPDKEALAGELATDGYHAWDWLYNIVSGAKLVPFEQDGKTRMLSLGQLQNKLDDADRDVRRRAFDAFNTAWSELSQVCSLALNFQAGFRQTLYRYRGWKSILQEPLRGNRLQCESLDAMWDVIARKSGKLVEYLEAKARLLGIGKMTWYDLDAPIGSRTRTFSYSEAGAFVVDSFRNFDPAIADFCQMAMEKNWIESEDRPGKRAGAFCTSLPLLGESRVFMTFDGSYQGVSTLAHELGHGYHGWVMRDLPFAARQYVMSTAETASTFNELVIVDASLRDAVTDSERLSLLNSKLQSATAYLMNIRARFMFDKAFYAARERGPLTVDELDALMLSAQKEAYCNALADDAYHPLFWASKLHFYLTRVPFYNFPYTFGFLFSSGIYDRALQEGRSFASKYVALLRDTGSMDTEALVHKHLGVDLTQPDFWEAAVSRVLEDVDPFVELATPQA